MAGAQFNKSHLLLIPEGEGPGGFQSSSCLGRQVTHGSTSLSNRKTCQKGIRLRQVGRGRVSNALYLNFSPHKLGGSIWPVL